MLTHMHYLPRVSERFNLTYIVLSPYRRRFFYATQLYTKGRTFTRLHGGGPGWGSAYQTLRRLGAFFTTRLDPQGWGESLESCALGASATLHSLTTILHGRGERQPAAHFLLHTLYTSHTRSSYSV